MKKNYFSLIASMFILFTVSDLQSQDVVSVVSGGTTGNLSPTFVYYGYSYSESIYLSSEIGASGDIDQIQLEWNGNEAITRDIVIALGHTSSSTFTSWNQLGTNSSGYTEVFNGSVTFPASAGYVTIDLDSSFSYNGSDNLLLSFDDNSGSYGSSGSRFLHTTTGLRTLVRYSDYTNYPGAGTLNSGGSSNAYNAVPNFKIQITSASCPSPASPSASMENMTQTSASLSWSDLVSGGADSFDIEYGASGFTQGSGTTIAGVTQNPYVLTGLTTGASYDFYVTANCSGGSSSDPSSASTFSTLCADQDTEYTMDFSTMTVSADGISQENCWVAYGDVVWEVAATTDTSSSSTGPGSGVSDGNYMLFEASGVAENATGTLVSPHIDLSNLTTPRLSYDYHMYGSTMGSLAVSIIESDGTETTLETLTGQQHSAETDEFLTSLTDLSSYSGVVRIKFTGTRGSDYYSDIAIDDFTVEETPSCLAPNGLSSASVDADSVILSWTANGSETEWDIEYGASGYTQGTGTTVSSVTSNPYTLTGLSGATAYDIYVRAACADGDSSWSSSVTITTWPTPLTTGFTENFDSALASTWTIVDDASNQSWQLWSWGNDGTSALGIRYSSGADHDDKIFSPTFTVTDGVTDGLSFRFNNMSDAYGADPISVYVYSNSDTSLGTVVAGHEEPAGVAGDLHYYPSLFDLSAYEGEDVRIMIHSTTPYLNQLYAFVDNFVIGSHSDMQYGWAGYTDSTWATSTNWFSGSVPTGDIIIDEVDSVANDPSIGSDISDAIIDGLAPVYLVEITTSGG